MNDEGPSTWRRFLWLQCGLIGGATLTLASLVKFILALPRLFTEDVSTTELILLPGTVFGLGFSCGVLVSLLRGLSARLGAVGDAAIGVVVMNAFFLGCMLCFDQRMLFGDAPGRETMLMLATGVGAILGVWTGHDLRREFRSGDPGPPIAGVHAGQGNALPGCSTRPGE